jgi:kynurenine 3-monooxygenase
MSLYTIIGAGPVGTLMALMLARRGQSVRLLERRPDPRAALPERGRSINLALAARGIVALEQADLMSLVAPQMIAMRGRMLHDEFGALEFLRYGQNEHEVIYAIDRERLNRVLLEAAATSPGIELEFGQRCLDVDPQAGILRLRAEDTGSVRSWPYEILLAADGAGSAVRAALVAHGASSIHEQPLAHDYKELVIPPSGGAPAPANYAFEPHALHIWPRGGHMLIALPNTDGSFTATLFLARHGDPGFDQLHGEAAVRSFFQQQFSDAAAAIPDLTQQFALHPQSRISTLHCERWHATGRILLLGDAAHAIAPFHGQGLNCGFEDCRILDRLLASHTDAGGAFAEFERERRPNTDAIAAMALENYLEMREAVRSPQFAARQQLAAELERRFPDRFIPRYSMVMFHPEIPYAEAKRRGEQQQRVLDALPLQLAGAPLDASALATVRSRLDEAGL